MFQAMPIYYIKQQCPQDHVSLYAFVKALFVFAYNHRTTVIFSIPDYASRKFWKLEMIKKFGEVLIFSHQESDYIRKIALKWTKILDTQNIGVPAMYFPQEIKYLDEFGKDKIQEHKSLLVRQYTRLKYNYHDLITTLFWKFNNKQ